MQLKDHYKTLGVKPSSAPADIKKAYRVLAVKYHPDKNPGSDLCEAQFKELNEAYSVLSDTRRRAAYDDERWLSGMGSRTSYNEAVTPGWIKNVCVELNASLAKMDTHRMSQSTLQAYIMLILDNAHLGVLQRENDRHTNNTIIQEILRATTKLELRYLDTVLQGLIVVAGTDAAAKQAIQDYATERVRQERRDQLFPYIIMAVTAALCVFMYFYAGMK